MTALPGERPARVVPDGLLRNDFLERVFPTLV